MEHYLQHELMLVGRGKRIDSVQPEKKSIYTQEEEEVLHLCTPFSCLGGPNGPTERERIADYLM